MGRHELGEASLSWQFGPGALQCVQRRPQVGGVFDEVQIQRYSQTPITPGPHGEIPPARRGARHRADVNVAADDDTTPLHAAMNLMESWSAQRGFMGRFRVHGMDGRVGRREHEDARVAHCNHID